MNKISYMGYTFIPYGNIIGKDGQTRFQRIMWRTDTLTPLLSKTDGYDYYEFNKAAGAAADIYYCPETKLHYVPIGGGLCSIDIAEMRKHIKLLEQDSNTSEDNMYSLAAMKQILGDDYGFHQSKTVDEVKRILATGEMPDNDDVPFMLEAGNLDIEINIQFDIEPITLEYFCCVRIDGKWESYNEILDEVNLDAPDLETEMFRVLSKYAEEEGLSFFAQNESYFRKYYPQCFRSKDIDDGLEM